MENRTGKKLSENLSNVFDRMDEANPSYIKIKKVIETEYLTIQQKLNPESDEDVGKELDHHFCDFVLNTLKSLRVK